MVKDVLGVLVKDRLGFLEVSLKDPFREILAPRGTVICKMLVVRCLPEILLTLLMMMPLQTALPGIHLGFITLQFVLHSTPGKKQQLQEQVVQARVIIHTVEVQQQLL